MNNTQHWKNTELIDIDDEEWIDAEGYDGIYEVSNFGRVKSLERIVLSKDGREMPIRARILKQNVGDSGLISTLCEHGICTRIMTSRIVFFSFNYSVRNIPEYFVMHINSDWKDNRLTNLKIGTRGEIQTTTFNHGKIDHIRKGNPMLSKHNRVTAEVNNGKIITKICKECNTRKPSNEFRLERNMCKSCMWELKRKKIGTKDRKCTGLIATDQITGEITTYKNFNDPELLKIISTTTAIKHVKNDTLCKPYLAKSKFNPFKLKLKNVKCTT